MQDTHRKHKSLHSLLVLTLILAGLLGLIGFTGCSSDNTDADIDYADAEITINGLEDQDFTVTVKELMELEAVTEKAEASRFNGDIVDVKATGPTLNTFLEKYGKTQADYELIRFTAQDKYAIAVPQTVLEERDIVLSYLNNGKALDEENSPIQVVVPGERAMYWVRMLSKIEFETTAETIRSERVVFLDTVLPHLGGEAIEDGTGVSVEELLENYGSGSGKVLITASDGLQKRETVENFLLGYIKYTGEYAPKFTSSELPEGMYVNGIVSIACGDVVYFSLGESMATMPERNNGDVIGIGFSDIVKDKNFIGGTSYKLIDINGNETELKDAELSAGVFNQNDGKWSFTYGEGKVIDNIAIIETQGFE